jgi:hypothetical protein
MPDTETHTVTLLDIVEAYLQEIDVYRAIKDKAGGQLNPQDAQNMLNDIARREDDLRTYAQNRGADVRPVVVVQPYKEERHVVS